MKCPICGCKMKEEFMCPFCKITGEQVRNVSNKEAIKRIKTKDTKKHRTKEGSLRVIFFKIRHSKREDGNHRRKDFIKY